MNTETKKVLALVALIVTTGVGTIEMTRSTAQANTANVAVDAAGYAADRVQQAFAVVETMPAVAAVSVPLADKGDLTPVAAYSVQSGPYVVVETRGESTSILTRMMGYTVAGFDATVTE